MFTVRRQRNYVLFPLKSRGVRPPSAAEIFLKWILIFPCLANWGHFGSGLWENGDQKLQVGEDVDVPRGVGRTWSIPRA